MAVIPLTLTISLVLALCFLGFFLAEQRRNARGGAERDSLLPLAEETSRTHGGNAAARAKRRRD
jgi:hypothetical protein